MKIFSFILLLFMFSCSDSAENYIPTHKNTVVLDVDKNGTPLHGNQIYVMCRESFRKQHIVDSIGYMIWLDKFDKVESVDKDIFIAGSRNVFLSSTYVDDDLKIILSELTKIKSRLLVRW